MYTLFDVLIAVEWLNGIILAKAPKGIDEVGAEVRVDVLRGELCIPLSERRKGLQFSLSYYIFGSEPSRMPPTPRADLEANDVSNSDNFRYGY